MRSPHRGCSSPWVGRSLVSLLWAVRRRQVRDGLPRTDPLSVAVLNGELFHTVLGAKVIIDGWIELYNTRLPHRGLRVSKCWVSKLVGRYRREG